LEGNSYPAKVNVLPGFPANVEVAVEYFPNSDADRKRSWVARGTANRFGHFVPRDKQPIIFDEPGEYVSRVTAHYRDARGMLWMGQQTSAGVIAPHERPMILHGTRSFPYDLKVNEDYNGGVKRFADRQDPTTSFLQFQPAALPDPFAPYDPKDTLFVASNGFDESILEPHLSVSFADPDTAKKFQDYHRIGSILPPPLLQVGPGNWTYLQNVVQISADSASWFPADRAHADELPVQSAADGAWHPFAFPSRRAIEGYIYFGVVRPGFPAMTGIIESETLGMYWLASPNRFGNHFNVGQNGDLTGDVYRILAGAVIKDFTTGKNYYDAYSAAITVAASDGTSTSILPPGRSPLVTIGIREHFIFLATDTHDALEVGEAIGLGGMVFPAIEADAVWTVTKPSGEQVTARSKANRLGLVRSSTLIPIDAPGIYTIKAQVRYQDLTGDVVGTKDGTFWHCAVPKNSPSFLRADLPPMLKIDPEKGAEILLTWPDDLQDVKLHYGVMMPGQVLDQGQVSAPHGTWQYRFNPTQVARVYPNVDMRNYATGKWELADTIVFQFFIEAKRGEENVYDSLRLVLRRDILMNIRAMNAPAQHGS
jgi:hypothetical protein